MGWLGDEPPMERDGDGAPIWLSIADSLFSLPTGDSPLSPSKEILNSLMLKVRDARHVISRLESKGIAWHLKSSLTALNIIAAVYGYWIPIGAKLGIDRVALLSKGHASLALYTWLSVIGLIDERELEDFSTIGSRLQAHPIAESVPGVLVSTGSLGQGLSIANGLAFASKIDGVAREVAVIMGDGELDEGQVWEAASTASTHGLDNVIVLIDRNMTQHTGPTEDVKVKEPLSGRWRAFGWHVFEASNSVEGIVDVLAKASRVKGKPKAVVVRSTSDMGLGG